MLLTPESLLFRCPKKGRTSKRKECLLLKRTKKGEPTEEVNYEANWGGKSGEDNSAQFTPSGDFINMEVAIAPSQLPAAAVSYVMSNYKNIKISEAGKITDAKGGISYSAEVKGKDLFFDEKGGLIKKEN